MPGGDTQSLACDAAPSTIAAPVPLEEAAKESLRKDFESQYGPLPAGFRFRKFDSLRGVFFEVDMMRGGQWCRLYKKSELSVLWVPFSALASYIADRLFVQRLDDGELAKIDVPVPGPLSHST
jgi:hypothetical protein